MITIIAAMTKDRVIGFHGSIPWHIPEDLHLFKHLTWGNTVVMGRTTYTSLGQPFKGRKNIILSRTLKIEDSQEIIVCRTFKECLSRGEKFGRDLFIIGGESVYRLALPMADCLYLSLIPGSFQGDTFFPEIDPFVRAESR